jgi:hypothetical protein
MSELSAASGNVYSEATGLAMKTAAMAQIRPADLHAILLYSPPGR